MKKHRGLVGVLVVFVVFLVVVFVLGGRGGRGGRRWWVVVAEGGGGSGWQRVACGGSGWLVVAGGGPALAGRCWSGVAGSGCVKVDGHGGGSWVMGGWWWVLAGRVGLFRLISSHLCGWRHATPSLVQLIKEKIASCGATS